MSKGTGSPLVITIPTLNGPGITGPIGIPAYSFGSHPLGPI